MTMTVDPFEIDPFEILGRVRAIDESTLLASRPEDAAFASALIDPGPPLVSDTMDDRLAEIDAACSGLPDGPSLQDLGFDGGAARAPSAAVLQRVGVHPAVAALPGGEAFGYLLGPGLDPAASLSFATGIALPARVRKMWEAVTRFVGELRGAVFGFESPVPAPSPASARVRCTLDGDLRITLAVPDVDPRIWPPGLAPPSNAITSLTARYAASIEVFTKVVALLVQVVKAALSPISAVRTLWKALRALYDLLVARLTSPT